MLDRKSNICYISIISNYKKATIKRRYTMKRIAKRLEDLFINITFAEEREFSNARNAVRRLAEKIEDTFTAIAFAEAGEFESAARYINEDGEALKSSSSGYPTRRFTRLCDGRA
jgi:phenylalanyl-tRNA synthetase alpha subunit